MGNKTQRQFIEETYQTVTQLSTVLLGVPDTEDTGLVGEVKEIKINFNLLCKSHSKLKRNFYIAVSALIASGVLGTGIWSLIGQ